MVPDADLQLQVVIKALSEAVAPAVDPTNKVAAEQLHLSIATLGMLRGQLPMARRFARALLERAIELAEALGEAGKGAGEARAAALRSARTALADPAAEIVEIEATRAELNQQMVALIDTIPAEARDRVDALVLEQSKAQIDLFRAWFVGSGFEPEASSIKPISDLIS